MTQCFYWNVNCITFQWLTLGLFRKYTKNVNTVKILNIGRYISEKNSVDSDQTALKEQSDQDLYCLPFCLHLLGALLHCKINQFYVKDN